MYVFYKERKVQLSFPIWRIKFGILTICEKRIDSEFIIFILKYANNFNKITDVNFSSPDFKVD